MKKSGKRKFGCVLINEGDKLTSEEKARLLEENQEKYGLSQEYIDYLKLPKASNVKVYDIDKIVYAKKTMSTSEKIGHLEIIK